MTASGAPLRIGIVGCGRATESLHLPALRGVAGAEVTALADVDAAALGRVAGHFSIPRRFADARPLLEDPAIDVVAVCVPVSAHADIAVAALEAGKHLFLEKPMALDLDSCDRIVAAAANARTKSVVGFNLRAHRLVAGARETVRRGDLGEIRVVESRWTSAIRDERALPAWRDRSDLGGGVLCEIAVHHFDLWRHLLDSEVDEIYAVTGAGDAREESAVVTARMANGVRAVGVFSDRTNATNDFMLHGTRGRLEASLYRYDGMRFHPTAQAPGAIGTRLVDLGRSVRELPRGVATLRRGGDFLLSYRREWEQFGAAIRGNRPVLCPLDEGREAVRVLLAALASAAERRPVRTAEAPRAAIARECRE